MKKNLNIQELAEALKNQSAMKYDVVASAKRLLYANGKLWIDDLTGLGKEIEQIGGITVSPQKSGLPGYAEGMGHSFNPTSIFDDQVCDKLGIPRAYFRRLQEEPVSDLLDHNINYWLQKIQDEKFLIRTFIDNVNPENNIARAFLSSSFKMIDNFDILMTALEAVKESGVELRIESCDLTDKKMYVRFIAPSVEIQAPELLKNYRVPGTGGTSGDHGILAGFILTNSETGHGAFSLSPRIMIKACNNGMISKRDSLRKIHVGGKMEESEIKYSEETEQKQLELIQLQIRDAVRTFITPEYVGKAADFILNANKPLMNPIDTVKNVSKELSFDEKKTDSILNYFIHSGDLSAFGVSQAVTFAAHKDADPDERFDMESQAFELVEIAAANDKPFVEGRRKSNKGFSNN